MRWIVPFAAFLAISDLFMVKSYDVGALSLSERHWKATQLHIASKLLI